MNKTRQKWIRITLAAMVVAAFLVTCGMAWKREADRQKALHSMRRTTQYKELCSGVDELDSILHNCDSASLDRLLSSFFNKIDDNYTHKYWLAPSNKPQYRNCNATYCYFMMDGDGPTNLRFVFQHEGISPLYANALEFFVDERPFTYSGLNFEINEGKDKRVSEWCDLLLSDTALVHAMRNAHSINIKTSGESVSTLRRLSEKDILSIRYTLLYYERLGGVPGE